MAALRGPVLWALPRGSELTLDPGVLGYAGAVAALTVLLFGLAPAALVLREGARPWAGVARRRAGDGGGRRLRQLLVAGETGLAVVLVLGAGLMLRTLGEIRGVDPGFVADASVFATVSLPGAREMAPGERLAFYREVARDVEALPTVERAAWTLRNPLRAGPGAGLRIRGSVGALASDDDPLNVRRHVVSPDYFETVGIPLVAGRGLRPGDGADSEPVAVVNETLARLAFGDADPVGALINTGLDGRDGEDWRWVRVVGVVGDTRNQGPTNAPEPAYFRPMEQGGPGFRGAELTLALRTSRPDPGLPDRVRRAVWAVDSSAPVFSVRRRTRELGVRLALGADGRGVVAMIVRQGMVPVTAGLLVGVVLAALLGRVLEGLLFGVDPLDPVTFAAVPLVMLATAAAALLIPARRAARVDPVTAMREE